MRILDHDRHIKIYISHETSIEHPSVGLASLAQQKGGTCIFHILIHYPIGTHPTSPKGGGGEGGHVPEIVYPLNKKSKVCIK